MAESDPFLIVPELWFGVLCHTVGMDQQKRIDLRQVFSRLWMTEPPDAAGVVAHAHLEAVLALGFSYGVGEFDVDIVLRDVDDRVLWERAEPWHFLVGPGDASGAVLAEKVSHWFVTPGNYYYVATLRPPGAEFRVRLEIAKRPREGQG